MLGKNTDQRKFLTTATIATLVFYFPLLMGSYYYRDDFERLITQKPGWSQFGRPFADLLTFFLSADWQWMPSSSPFFLLIALFLTATSACLSLKIRNIPFNPTTAVLLVAYIFNPFLLSAFLYQFDCVIMAMALACSVLGWAYYSHSKIKSAVLCFISMGFYQSYINMFIILSLIEALYSIYNGNKISVTVRFFIKAFLFSAFISILFYFFAKLFVYGYAAQKSQFVFSSSKGAWHYVAITTENAFSHFFGFLSLTGKVTYGFAICIAFIQLQLHFYKDTKFDNPVLRAIICSVSLLFMLPISLCVLYGIVGDSGVPPRLMAPSIFFSVSIIFLVLRFLTRFQKPELKTEPAIFAATKLTWAVIVLLLLCPLVFSYIVNSAIRIQNTWSRYYLQRIATSLERYPAEKPSFVLGVLGNSIYVKSTLKRMRLVTIMIPHLRDWTLTFQLKEFGFNNIKQIGNAQADELVTRLCTNNVTPDIKTPYYKIFNLGDHNFIWLGKKDMCSTDYNRGIKHYSR
ncbi:glucosyltransferase domain-containing protein [uncultured Bartonella sp.]|uniref:glucosyltransferase domain-containing protein n=1 Tax=uncultured Bartonella sp. TaxID=104108 RepID=UPI0025F4E4B7|nr:glucosyltransferase domain-containing protein [uncultured Bartonella sp.]